MNTLNNAQKRKALEYVCKFPGEMISIKFSDRKTELVGINLSQNDTVFSMSIVISKNKDRISFKVDEIEVIKFRPAMMSNISTLF